MSEEVSYIPEPPETFAQQPEKKNRKTLWIILGVVAVLLLCCCLVVVLGTVLGFVPFLDEMFTEFMYEGLPFLAIV